jgi:hypothetical protein
MLNKWHTFLEGFIHFRIQLEKWTWDYDEKRHVPMGLTRESYYNCRFNDLTRGDYWRYETAPWSLYQKVKEDVERNRPGYTLDMTWRPNSSGRWMIHADIIQVVKLS